VDAVKTKAMKMWLGNYDGRREALVIASTKKRAREVSERSVTEFNRFWHEVPINTSLDPEVLYTRPYGNSDVPWQRGRCPL
jgi:hypothetical protein